MGLDEVVQEVRNGAKKEADEIIAAAQAEADRMRTEAQQTADAYSSERAAQAERDVEQIRTQALSNAEFEARKQVLQVERTLRDELRDTIIEGLEDLSATKRAGHIKKLLDQASTIIPAGKVWGAAKDADLLKASDYEYGGELDIAGGLIVESADGKERIDLSYETLLDDSWRNVLAAEAGLFH